MGGLDGASGNGVRARLLLRVGDHGTFNPDGNPGTFNNRGQVARHNAVIQEAGI